MGRSLAAGEVGKESYYPSRQCSIGWRSSLEDAPTARSCSIFLEEIGTRPLFAETF